MDKAYDFIVIGGGAAGFSAVTKLNELLNDPKILLVNRGPIGGTCVNNGCVPSKALIEYSKRLKYAMDFIGRTNADFKPDYSDILAEIRNLVRDLRIGKYERILDNYPNVDYVSGSARFIAPNKIRVSGYEDCFKGGKFLIATGSRPNIPPIEGIDKIQYYTNVDFWDSREIPSSILIVGAGPVGLEISQSLARLGVDVYVVDVLERPLPRTEPEVANVVVKSLSEDGVKFFFKSTVKRVSKASDGVNAEVEGEWGSRTLDVEAVFIAAGRRPNTEDLGLDRAGVEVDKGFVKVDSSMKTSNPSIYAAGDVAASPKPAFLETLAAREGLVAAYHMAGRRYPPIDYSSVPVVVFTDPEVAYVGMTEEEVFKELGTCSCRGVRFNMLPKSMIIGRSDGYAKLIVDPRTSLVKGVHVAAPYASEFIVQASLFIRNKYSLQDVLDTIQVFPSSAEIIKLSAQAFIRDIGNMPCCVE